MQRWAISKLVFAFDKIIYILGLWGLLFYDVSTNFTISYIPAQCKIVRLIFFLSFYFKIIFSLTQTDMTKNLLIPEAPDKYTINIIEARYQAIGLSFKKTNMSR